MSGFIPLSVPNFGAREAELAGLAITSGWVSTSGGKVTEFEEKLAAYVGMPRAVACNAGTSALHLAAMAAAPALPRLLAVAREEPEGEAGEKA